MPDKKINPRGGSDNTEKAQVENKKTQALEQYVADASGEFLTNNHGTRISDDQHSLKAGDRGPTLLEDFLLREKITHFDHERIPERVVHARGSAAHGVFKLDQAIPQFTRARFLTDSSLETPVFVRFSTVAGSRGSTDLARDVRGFAVKFYTEEGNFDLVGNNMPVFFIQDAIKFPDLVHAVKPEPHNEIPQAASAHDTFWDFISNTPESAHMIMWLMSDRALPRSYSMMEGFGVHTFRFINAEDKACFVKFHWKPLAGVHAVAWNEAQDISGKDPDFHRRDLWESIENGNFPQWELGVQIVAEEDEHKFEFDLLDPTKLIPEELVPVQRIGTMTLNRNPDNFFAETEQVAFHIGHVVPGIDFTNDPLLQGRLFSYTDTQLIRLGGPNFHEIPINRPVVPVHNNQRDGLHRQTINRGKTAHGPNTMGGGCPFQAGKMQGGFTSFPENMTGFKTRGKSESFFDHFSQAKLFFHSQSEPEKNHMIDALSFELGKVELLIIRERILHLLLQIDENLAAAVAYHIGMHVPKELSTALNQNVPADGDPEAFRPVVKEGSLPRSAALSMAGNLVTNLAGRKVAILACDGVDDINLNTIIAALKAEGAGYDVISSRLGFISGISGASVPVDKALLTSASVFYDAVYVPGGSNSVGSLESDPDALHFLNEAFRHCKPIAADDEALQVLEATYFSAKIPEIITEEIVLREGIVIGTEPAETARLLISAMRQHRFWKREKPRKIPA